MLKLLFRRENASITEVELSRKNDHHDLKESYCLLHSQDGASTLERGVKHHWRSEERKKIAEEKDFQHLCKTDSERKDGQLTTY